MIPTDFAIFILSHGRPDRVDTYKSLKTQGYTGAIYILIDNEDECAPEYERRYGDRVIVFDKAAAATWVDVGDNFPEMDVVVFARNACFQVARNLGLTCFMELDDDYTSFVYKTDNHFNLFHERKIRNLDPIIGSMLEFYKSISAKSIAMAQCGDYIGGVKSNIHRSLNQRRKAMNSFFCSVDRPFPFAGRVNEDVTAYTWFQSMGGWFLTFPLIALHQRRTQSNEGGLTDEYLRHGTYVKSFYTVMFSPASVSVSVMGEKHMRLHHRINWDHTIPCLIGEQFRKSGS